MKVNHAESLILSKHKVERGGVYISRVGVSGKAASTDDENFKKIIQIMRIAIARSFRYLKNVSFIRVCFIFFI